MNTTTRKDDNPNSSESVEASLEDFISKANASFPASDGWDLHTGDVELVDDEDEAKLEAQEHVAPPIVVRPAQRKADPKPAAALDDPNAKTVVTAMPKRRSNPFEVPVPLVDEPPPVVAAAPEPAPLDPPPTGPRRRSERTEVVAAPLPRAVPWTANPLVWIAGVFAAFVAGAVVVFAMVRTMLPSQPVVVQAPPPVVVPAQPAAATTAPVVTPLGQQPSAVAHQAAQPVVTPLPAPAAPKVEVASEKVTVAKPAKPARHAHHAARPRPAQKAVAQADEASDDDDDSAAAARKPAHAAKKESSAKPKGGDWVDPFAQ